MVKRFAGSLSRRSFLRTILIASSGIALAACASAATPPSLTAEPVPRIPTPTDDLIGASQDESIKAHSEEHTNAAPVMLPPTPACDDDDEPTPPQTAGPFYTPNTPRRNSFLEPGISGTRMIVTGYVLDTTCRPIPGAMLDFWHCDDAGVYDNLGYKLRGHFFADDAGRYTLETIQPGIYPGRTRHFHVRVQAPNRPVLTTQLYFPGEQLNARDRLFRPECLMEVRDHADGSKTGFFNFILQLN